MGARDDAKTSLSKFATPARTMDDSKSFDIYADLDDATPRLPSSTELSADLAAARAEREALEARLQNLRSDYAAGREAIQELTRKACVILVTARLELQRKDEALATCRKQIAGRRRAREEESRRVAARTEEQQAAAAACAARTTVIPGAALVELSDSEEGEGEEERTAEQ